MYGQQGIGNQMYVGAGAAIFINTYTNFRRLKYWTNWPYLYTVGGYGYKPKNEKKETITMTKNTIEVQYYDTVKHTWKYKSCTKGTSSAGCPTSSYKPGLATTVEEPGAYTRMMQGGCAGTTVDS